jgi:myosin-5
MDSHAVGSRVWLKDEAEAWTKAEVVRIDGAALVVKTEKGTEVKAKPEELPLQNPDARGVEVGV